MKILADRHHQGLTESLILLFQKRLGWEIYFQKGMEWYPEFWDLQPFKDTATQYLERELEGLPGITLEEFNNTTFDVLLCSVPQHVGMWLKLKELYQPQAKLIFQVGNMWTFDNNFPIKNILASAKVYPYIGFNVCEYHQEFDLEIFHFEPVKKEKKIYSFINCLNTVDLYKRDWELFLELEKLMPDWEFKSFGGQCRDGAIWDRKELADKMREATFIYQVKNQGDGYGHNIFSSAAVGRPLIVRASDYANKLAECLIDGTTSITIDHFTPPTVANVIRTSWDTDTFTPEIRGKNIYDKFKANVNFDVEAIKIDEFLTNLI